MPLGGGRGQARAAATVPGVLPALEGVVVKQRQNRGVVGHEAARDVDHPLTLLVGLEGHANSERERELCMIIRIILSET